MLPAQSVPRTAHCANVLGCPRAAAGEAVEWYLGAGEYCPECGEVLVAGAAAKVPSVRGETAGRMGPPASRYADGEPRLPLTAVDKLSAPPTGRENGTLVAALPRST